ncbi:MAG: helix-turn-helix transcriptional regulator [Cyclobacteriaceae bacterium]
MITRRELLRSPEYWFEHAQNDLYGQVVEFMEREGVNQTQLAERLGVTKGYISQLLNGEFNHTLKKLIDISLSIGVVPKIEYQSISNVVDEDNRVQFIRTDDIFSSLDSKGSPSIILRESETSSDNIERMSSEPNFKHLGQVA